MKKNLTLTLLGFLVACSQNNTVNDFNLVEMDQVYSPASGVCTATFTLTEVYGQQVSLIELSVSMRDALDRRTSFVYSGQGMLDVLTSNVLPANGQVQGGLSLNLAGGGLVTPPAVGTLLVVGNTTFGTSQFVGDLSCNSF